MAERLFALAWNEEYETPYAMVLADTDDLDEFMEYLRSGDVKSWIGAHVQMDFSKNQYWAIYRGRKVAFMGAAYQEIKFDERV